MEYQSKILNERNRNLVEHLESASLSLENSCIDVYTWNELYQRLYLTITILSGL